MAQDNVAPTGTTTGTKGQIAHHSVGNYATLHAMGFDLVGLASAAEVVTPVAAFGPMP